MPCVRHRAHFGTLWCKVGEPSDCSSWFSLSESFVSLIFLRKTERHKMTRGVGHLMILKERLSQCGMSATYMVRNLSTIIWFMTRREQHRNVFASSHSFTSHHASKPRASCTLMKTSQEPQQPLAILKLKSLHQAIPKKNLTLHAWASDRVESFRRITFCAMSCLCM